MKIIFIITSIVGLGLTIIPAALVFTQSISLASHKHFMFAGMILWFITAPYWLKEQKL